MGFVESTPDQWENRQETLLWDRFNCIEGFTFGIESSQEATRRPSANADPDSCGGFKGDKIVTVPGKQCGSSLGETSTSNFQVWLLCVQFKHFFLCYFGGSGSFHEKR